MKARQMSKIAQYFNKHSEMISPRMQTQGNHFISKGARLGLKIINAFTVPTLTLIQPLPYQLFSFIIRT